MILTTIYLAGAKNTDSWHTMMGDLQCAFSQAVSMIPPKLSFITNSNNPTDVGLAPGSTIHFGSLEFIANCFGHLSLPQLQDSDAIFVGMIRDGSPSLRTELEDSSSEDGTTYGTRMILGSPSPRGCYVVTSIDPIIDTPDSKNTPALQTIPTVTIQMALPQPGMELPQDWQQAY
jgi:hypothetical protein